MLSLEEMEQNILAVMNQQAAELSEKAAELNRNEGELRLVQRMKKIRDEEKEKNPTEETDSTETSLKEQYAVELTG